MNEENEPDDFERKIIQKFQTDNRTILQAHLDELEGMFRFHEDGNTELLGEYRDLSNQDQILIRLIAERYKSEVGISDNASIPYSEIYPLFPEVDDSTVRGYFMKLRQDGYAEKTNEGHRLVVQRLQEAIERIEEAVSSTW